MNLNDVTGFLPGQSASLPVILQNENSECGYACLAMVASFHGHHVSLLELRELFGPAPRGISLLELIGCASKIRLVARAIRAEIEHVADLATPCILHWNLNHFVVLKKVITDGSGKIKTAHVHDPARGHLTLNASEFSKSFTGVVVELTPMMGFARKAKPRSVRIRDLVRSTYGLKAALLQIGVIAVALEAANLLAPYFMQLVVDGVLLNQDLDVLYTLALGFGILTLVQVVLGIFRSWCVLSISVRVNVQWLCSLYNHLLRLPISYFSRRNLADIVSRFNSIHLIQRTISAHFVEAAIDGILIVSMLLMMLIYSVTLSLIVLFFAGAYVVVRLSTYENLRRSAEEYTRLQAREQSSFLESIRGIQTIKLHGDEPAQFGRWSSLLVSSVNRSTKGQQISLAINSSFQLLSGVENILIISTGATLVISSQLTVGMILAFLAFRGTFSHRFQVLVDKLLEFRMLSVHTERLADIALEPAEEHEGPSVASADLQSDRIRVELNDIWFRYSENEPWILRGVNLVVEPGENLAIAGASGSGKTTLFKIMLGLLRPTRGIMKVNGVPIEQIGIGAYRSMLAAVMQDDALFSGSLRENISFFDNDVDEERVCRACDAAAVLEDIERMPMRLNTMVGDMGSTLSGGQRQRVLLARALYRSPKLLLMDEATSHLDSERERKVNDAVKRLAISRVVIAHREETLNHADRILFLENGELSLRGEICVDDTDVQRCVA